MDYYYDLKKMLCKELENVANQKELSAGDLETVDKLTHSIKSLVTIMAMEDGGYSYNNGYSGARKYMDNSYGRYNDGGRYYDNGYSGRRYSRDEGKSYMIQQFERLMNDASSQEEHEVLQSAINRLKNM